MNCRMSRIAFPKISKMDVQYCTYISSTTRQYSCCSVTPVMMKNRQEFYCMRHGHARGRYSTVIVRDA